MPAPDRSGLARARDFSGRPFTLPRGMDAWRFLGGSGADLLFLGGAETKPIELPIASGKPAAKIRHLPDPGQALEQAPKLAPKCRVYFYKPDLRIKPDQWTRVLARVDLALAGAQTVPAPRAQRIAWLPGNERQLLHQELKQALAGCDYAEIIESAPEADAAGLCGCWQGHRPDLAISVNFNGLDPQGHIFELCRELEVPLAIWLVDNPWNLLSGIPLPWWKDAHIFVTDKSFIADMRNLGASNVWHLPLAASWHMFSACGNRRLPPLFIGRSEFPAKKGFFAGISLDDALLVKAGRQEKPDFHWWQQQYKPRLWPGREMRKTALGAEEMSVRRKSRWLASLLNHTSVRITGDAGWHRLLGDIPIQPPVDYYGSLPALYGDASCVLNITSLLLPQSLNQRHFDVWAAGGFLLTDATEGLDIFPSDLTAEIACNSPEEMAAKIAGIGNKNMLAEAWREHISQFHRYGHRIREIEEKLGI